MPTENNTDDSNVELPAPFNVDVLGMTPTDGEAAIDAMNDDLAERKTKIDEGTSTAQEIADYKGLRRFKKEQEAALTEAMADLDDEEEDIVESAEEVETSEDGETATEEEAPETETEMSQADEAELVMAGLKKLASSKTPAKFTEGSGAPVAPKYAAMYKATANRDSQGNMVAGSIPMTDEQWATNVADRFGSTTAGREMDLGGWDQWEGDTSKRVASNMPANAIREVVGRDYSGNHKMDPKTAAPCQPGCVRRDIADCGDMSDPLNIFTEFPCDRGTVEYFQSISLSEVEDAVTVWDEAAQAAHDAAYDAWKTAAKNPATDPQVLANTYAALQAATKHCARVSCQTGVKAAVLPIAICLEITNEVGYSNPEAILAYRSAIARLLLRRRNAQRRLMLQKYSHHYQADLCDDRYGKVGSAPAVFQAIGEALAAGTVAERLEEGGYWIGIDRGLMTNLGIDLKKAGQGFGADDIAQCLHGLPFVELLEGADGAATQSPYQSVQLNQPGPANKANLPGIPTGTWQVEIFRPADFDTISVPQISLTATRGTAEAKSNTQLNMFLETFEGLLKPGCNPNFTLHLDNVIPSGARVDQVPAIGCAPVGP